MVSWNALESIARLTLFFSLQDGDHFDDTSLEEDTEHRKAVERSLLRKVDRRMSILVLIYILNCQYLNFLLQRITDTFYSDIDRNNVSYESLCCPWYRFIDTFVARLDCEDLKRISTSRALNLHLYCRFSILATS